MTTANGSAPGSARGVASALLHAWWIVALSVVVGGAVGVAISLSLPERYVGSVTLLVQLPQGADDTEALVRTVEALTSSTVVLGDVAEKPGVDLSESEIADRLTVDRAAGSAVLQVSVVGTSERQARTIAEELVPALKARLAEVAPNDAVKPDGKVASLPIRVVRFGGEPYVHPEPRQPVVTGALFGIALGLVVAVAVTARASRRAARPWSH